MTEGERIIKVETQMTNIENKVENIQTTMDKRFDSMEKTLGDFIEKSEDKFASKWVEKALWGAGAVIGTALILALLSLIIIK